MIFYKNTKKNRKLSHKNLKFSIFDKGIITDKDQSVLSANAGIDAYNLAFRDGALKTGLGFEDLKVPSSKTDLNTCHTYDFSEYVGEIKNIWLRRWFSTDLEEYIYQIFLIDENYQIWYVLLLDEYGGYVWRRSKDLVSMPTYECNYRFDDEDCSLFFTEEGMLYVTHTTDKVCDNVPAMISCVVHYGNFFGITNKNRNTLVYSTNLDLRQWSDENSSTIEFLDSRGAFTKLVSFNDYVYLFRENGITKISLYSSNADFSFTHLYTSSSKIFESSVQVCGSVVIFATRNGLYKFNGNSVNKIFDNYDGYIQNFDNSNCASACLEGKYYLATKYDFADGKTVGCEEDSFVNNVLFEFDIEKNSVNILRGVDIKNLLAVDTPYTSKLCACFNNENKQRIGQLNFSGSIFEKTTEKSWKSALSDLNIAGKRKKVKEIFLTSLYDAEIEIVSDEESKTYKVFGSKNEQRIQISVYGRSFQFVFRTNEAECKITNPVAVFDVLE